VCVYDTGLGIEPQDQSLVFEEFYQVGNRERDRSKGLVSALHRAAAGAAAADSADTGSHPVEEVCSR